MKQKILVTGAAGYIGSILVRLLLERGYFVRGLDALLFGGESLLEVYNCSRFEFMKSDIRREEDLKKAIREIDHVIHLAAIVGDPACGRQPDLCRETNWMAAKMLFDICHEHSRVKKFIFASTCSNYGKMEGKDYVDEKSLLKPLSLYAELKVKFEKFMLKTIERDDFIPISLRFSTAYGISSRMRFDLTVNEFVREVTLGKELQIYGEQFWRPYCHVKDLARACVLVLECEDSKVRQNVYNVGDTKENYQKKSIAEIIRRIEPEAKIEYIFKEEDPRDYRVDFSKIQKELNFQISKTVVDGIYEVHSAIKNGILSNPYSSKYRNI